MEELKSIMEKLIVSGCDVISVPAWEWLCGTADKYELINTIRQASARRDRYGVELKPLYKRALELLQ